MAMRAEGLVEDRWYRVRVTRPGGLVVGAPALKGPVRLDEGRELTLVWRGPGPGGRWQGGGAPGGTRWVGSAGTFWSSYDAGAALIVYYEDVEVLGEAPGAGGRA
jgi:hypothetical protein